MWVCLCRASVWVCGWVLVWVWVVGLVRLAGALRSEQGARAGGSAG